MSNDKIKKVCCGAVAVLVLFNFIFVPLASATAKIRDKVLDIDPYTAEIKDAYSRIKNAGVVHLVAQKMKRCVEAAADPSSDLKYKDAATAKNGDVWSGFFDGNITTGPWLGELIGGNGGDSGIINCSTRDSKIFDMFVYTLKYPAQVKNVDLGSFSVTEADRIKVLCNKNDPTKPGLVRAVKAKTSQGETVIEGDLECNSSAKGAKYVYNGSEGIDYIKNLYNEMVAGSGNDYLPSWNDADFDVFNKLDSYPLYKRDFEKQCTGGGGSIDVSVFMVNDSGEVEEENYKVPTGSFSSFVGSKGGWTCVTLANKMNELVAPHIKFVNQEVGKNCKKGIDEAIGVQSKQIIDKYINNPDVSAEDKAEAQTILDEYNNVQSHGLYVKKKGVDDEKVEPYNGANVPDNYVWTCREKLPYIDIEVDEEGDFAEALEREFYDACLQSEEILLPWVVCPMIDALAGAVDMLANGIEGFFE